MNRDADVPNWLFVFDIKSLSGNGLNFFLLQFYFVKPFELHYLSDRSYTDNLFN